MSLTMCRYDSNICGHFPFSMVSIQTESFEPRSSPKDTTVLKPTEQAPTDGLRLGGLSGLGHHLDLRNLVGNHTSSLILRQARHEKVSWKHTNTSAIMALPSATGVPSTISTHVFVRL